MVKARPALAVAALLGAACLVDVKVGGPGYACQVESDCGELGPCVEHVCSPGSAGGGAPGGGAAGGDGGGVAGGSGGGVAGGSGGGVAGGSGGGVAGGSGGGVAGGSGGGVAGGSGGGVAGGSAMDAGRDGGVDAGTDAGVDAGLPWWNAAYTKRQQLTIHNNAGATMAMGFQVGWQFGQQTLIGGGNSNQIRLVRWSGNSWTEQHRVIDTLSGGNTPWMWLKTISAISAGGTDSTYWLYFGNSAPPAAMDIDALVFDLFEPFSGTSLGSTWAPSMGSPLVANSEVALDYDEHIRTSATYGPNEAVDFFLRGPTSASGRFWGGYQIAGTFADSHPWAVWISRMPMEIWPEFTIDQNPISSGTHQSIPSGAQLYGIDRFSDRLLYRSNDTVVGTLTPATVPYTAPLNIRFTNEATATVYVSMVRTRKTIYPLPTVTNGPIEP